MAAGHIAGADRMETGESARSSATAGVCRREVGLEVLEAGKVASQRVTKFLDSISCFVSFMFAE